MVFSCLCAVIVHRNNFFRLYQKKKSSESKGKFRQASNCCKRVLQAAKVAHSNKTKESITSHKLGSADFWWIANTVFNKGKSTTAALFNYRVVLSKLFAKNCSKKSNLDDSGISLSVSSSKTNLKLHISVTPKTVKKVITNLDSLNGIVLIVFQWWF